MTSGAADSKWIVRFRSAPRACLRLFCFPYAGGGASIFHHWAAELPDDIEVCAIQLPGREDRIDEDLIRSFRRLISELMLLIPSYLDLPVAIFGHSLGALIGYELARHLHQETGSSPVHLFISGCAAPHIPSPKTQIHLLPDEQFLDEMRKLNGTPEEILERPELKQLYLPILRADMGLSETYFYLPGKPLLCPLSAFGGDQDQTVKKTALDAWQRHTQAKFRLHMLPGDHFFLRNSRRALLEAIRYDLQTL